MHLTPKLPRPVITTRAHVSGHSSASVEPEEQSGEKPSQLTGKTKMTSNSERRADAPNSLHPRSNCMNGTEAREGRINPTVILKQ